jgi:hypothetical protein
MLKGKAAKLRFVRSIIYKNEGGGAQRTAIKFSNSIKIREWFAGGKCL